MATPDNFCPHRIQQIQSGDTVSPQTTEPAPESATTQETTLPLCAILFRAGSHLVQCKAPNIAENDCLIPLVASGDATIQEGADWLKQIHQDQPPSPSTQ